MAVLIWRQKRSGSNLKVHRRDLLELGRQILRKVQHLCPSLSFSPNHLCWRLYSLHGQFGVSPKRFQNESLPSASCKLWCWDVILWSASSALWLFLWKLGQVHKLHTVDSKVSAVVGCGFQDTPDRGFPVQLPCSGSGALQAVIMKLFVNCGGFYYLPGRHCARHFSKVSSQLTYLGRYSSCPHSGDCGISPPSFPAYQCPWTNPAFHL